MPQPTPQGDPADPSTWWRALVHAVIDRQRGDRAGVVEYLRFVEAHRGREEALRARERLGQYARSPSFANVALWPGWGYRHKAPDDARGTAKRGATGRRKG